MNPILYVARGQYRRLFRPLRYRPWEHQLFMFDERPQEHNLTPDQREDQTPLTKASFMQPMQATLQTIHHAGSASAHSGALCCRELSQEFNDRAENSLRLHLSQQGHRTAKAPSADVSSGATPVSGLSLHIATTTTSRHGPLIFFTLLVAGVLCLPSACVKYD